MEDPFSTVPELQRGLLSDQIYQMIKAMIKDARLRPGEQLVESQLARQLHVSQAPVRDALKRLGHEGLITHVRHQGNFVATFSDEEAAQAKAARASLESMAAGLATGNLSESTRSALHDLINQMHIAATDKRLGDFRELDFAFHRAVVEASGNVYLPRFWDVLEPSLRSMHVLGDPDFRGDWELVAQWHDSLLAVLEGDDRDASAELFRAHAAGTLLGEDEQTSSAPS